MILLWHRSHTMCRVGSAAFASGAVHHRKIHQLYNWILWSYIAVIIQYINPICWIEHECALIRMGVSGNSLKRFALQQNNDIYLLLFINWWFRLETRIECLFALRCIRWHLTATIRTYCSKIDCLFRGSRRNNNNLSSSHNNTTVHYALWFCFQVTKQSMFHGGIFGVSSRVLQPHVTAHEMLSDCGHAHASAGAYRAGCRCYNAALFQTRFNIHCTSRSATLLSVAQLQPTFTFTAAPHWHRRLWSRYLDDLCGDLAGKKIAIKTCPPRQVTA